MIALLRLRWAILPSPFKSGWQLEAENVALPHQVVALRSQMHVRVRLTDLDRLVPPSFTAGFRQSFGRSHAILHFFSILGGLHLHYSMGFISIIVEFEVSAHIPPGRSAP
jgi:hypothetical protein